MAPKKLFIEKVKLDKQGFFVSSDLIEATEDQIAQFKSRPCDHSLNVDKLVYDEPAWLYDLRYCGVCNAFIDFI
jgi:hypothetical protein